MSETQSTYGHEDGQKLIVVFTERYRLGMTAIPYLSYKDPNEPMIKLVEQMTSARVKNYPGKFSDAQLQIIKILDEISDPRLYKKYSREATVKDFLNKLTNDLLEKRIRPDIEKRITQCIELLALSGDTDTFLKSTNYSQLYPDDKLGIPVLPSEAVFYFDLQPFHLEYTLKVREKGSDFGLLGRQLTFITHEPCSFILNQKLYRFTDIDSKKLKPFLEKTAIRVPAASIDNYMEKFVSNCIRDFHVVANGFDIVDKSGMPQPVLNLEQDLAQQPVLSLYFVYAGKRYQAGTNSKVYTELEKNGNRYTIYKIERKKSWEESIARQLTQLGLEMANNCQFRPPMILRDNPSVTLHNLINWLNINHKSIDELGIEIEQSFFDQNYYLGLSEIIKQVEETQDWFDLKMLVKIGNFLIPFIKFRKHIASLTREFQLPDGSLFVIPDEWFARFSELLHFAKNADGDTLQIDRTHFNLVQEALELQLESVRNLNESLNRSLAGFKSPQGLKADLRPYQLQGFFWMKQLSANSLGGILADDMGLGKTIQTISLILDTYESVKKNDDPQDTPRQLSLFGQPHVEGFNKTDAPPSLIVMPTSLVHNWQNEIQKFAPSLKVYNYTGQNRLKTRDIGKIFRHYHVVLTSYGVLRNDIEYFKNVHFQYVILDESQNIKNPSSKLYDVVMELRGHHRLVLTGTPIENSLADLWAQMNFVNQGLLGTLSYFKNQFVNPISKQQSEEHEKRLQALINPYILRRTKEMVAKELPPVTEQTLYCDMTPEQKKLYEQEKSGIRNKLLNIIAEQGIEKSGMVALQALTRLRQLANHPLMVDEHYTGSSGKYEQILENLESIVSERHKVLVFSSFVKDLELIENELEARKLPYSKLTGATGNRQHVIKQFKDHEECRIFLISLKAGGVGLNLTEADYVFMLNPWWNPAAELQAINRAHRIGQTRNVFVYRFISNGTIEEKIARLQEKKQALADTFINSNNPFKNMTEDEIKELFA
ncbi:MAG: DEAD/DEAH box helicase [Breznakibacter sp.]